MPQCQEYKPTFILIALNIAVFAYTSLVGGDFIYTNPDLLVQYGQVNVLVTNGYWYQLFTSMFVHVSVIHIAGNLLFLFIFGLRAEEMFSLPEYFGIYLVSGLAGNLLTLIGFGFNSPIPSAGASGAIFGMFGACVIYDRRSIGQSIVGALIYAFFLFIISSSGPEVNYFAHFGGLGAGLLIGYVIASLRKPEARYHVTYSYGRGPLMLMCEKIRALVMCVQRFFRGWSFGFSINSRRVPSGSSTKARSEPVSLNR
jgi:rhomboid protease GluP